MSASWGLHRPGTEFQPDAIVPFTCRHCARPPSLHGAGGECYAPIERLFHVMPRRRSMGSWPPSGRHAP